MPMISGAYQNNVRSRLNYVAGGTVQAGRGVYLARSADLTLLELCRQRQFAYILSSRQMGKSSLMTRVQQQLISADCKTAFVDLTKFGVVGVQQQQWYNGLVHSVSSQLGLSMDDAKWWGSSDKLSVSHRFSLFLENCVDQISGPIVIFIDEIDSTLSLSFTDDFFGAVRHVYNNRAQKPALARLTFVLAGVATPSQLIRDPKRTPFNIGQLVDLTDFTISEALPLTAGLVVDEETSAREVLHQVLYWTGGHPYLTLRVFRELTALEPSQRSPSEVDNVVRSLFFDLGPENDGNIEFVSEMLTKEAELPDKVLGEYLAIRSGQDVPDREADRVKAWLRLSGVVRRDGKMLRVRNRIYEAIFTVDWVESNLAVPLRRKAHSFPDDDKARIYLSYARDGRELAARFYADVLSFGYQSAIAKERMSLTWTTEVAAAVDSANVVLCILTPLSARSIRCGLERTRALRAGKTVIFIAVGEVDDPLESESAIKLRITSDSDYSSVLPLVLEMIKARRGASLRPRFRTTQVTAPPLPANYVERPEILGDVRNLLFADENRPSIAIIALQGMGGIGKTVIAQAVAHDSAVQDAFPDGVIWISSGKESRQDVVQQFREVGKVFGDDPYVYQTDASARNRYRSVLRNKAALIILDDVWLIRDVESFRAETFSSRILITTRDAGISSGSGANAITVGVLSPEQAAQILANWCGLSVENLPTEAKDLVVECAGHPLALATIGAMLRQKPLSYWRYVHDRFRRIDISQFRQQSSSYPYPNLLRALEVSVDALEPRIRADYLALAVVLENMTIKPRVQQSLWGLGEFEALGTAEELVRMGLAERSVDDGIRLHPLLLDYIRAQYPDPDALALIHAALRLSTYVIERAPDQFASQMLGRLIPFVRIAMVAEFCASLRNGSPRPWLCPLKAALQSPGTGLLQTLAGHDRSVNAIAVTSDGRRAVSASQDKALKVWEIESGRELQTLFGHAGRILGVALTPDGRRAVSASADRTLVMWDIDSGRALRTLPGHDGPVRTVSVSPDGRYAVSGSADGTLKVWELESGRTVRTLVGHAGGVNSVAITPNGQRAVSASEDWTIKVWDLQSGNVMHTLTGHIGPVSAVVLAPEAREVLSASADSTVKMWDIESGCELKTLSVRDGPVGALAVTPSGEKVLAALSRTIKVINADTGQELSTLSGHVDRIRALAVTPDGRRALSGSADRTVKVWDLEKAHEIRGLDGHRSQVTVVAIALQTGRAVSASIDGLIKVWDLRSGSEVHTLAGHRSGVRVLALTRDGQRAVSGSGDGILRLWELETGRVLKEISVDPQAITALAVAPDGLFAIAGSRTGGLAVADLAGDRDLFPLAAHRSRVTAVMMSPDGQRIVSASDDGTLSVWLVDGGQLLQTLNGHSSSVLSVAITPDGQNAVSSSADSTLRVWDLDSGRMLRMLIGHVGAAYMLTLTPDGRQVISVGKDRKIRVWDLGSGVEVRALEGHSAPVRAVALTADGRRVVSASSDRTIKVWDLQSGAIMATFFCDAGATCCAVADGIIAAGDAAGQLHLLELKE